MVHEAAGCYGQVHGLREAPKAKLPFVLFFILISVVSGMQPWVSCRLDQCSTPDRDPSP